MKQTLTLCTLLFCCLAFGQNVTIPNVAFKAKLLSHTPTIDTNGDDEIQLAEAQSFTDTLNINGDPSGISDITDITGIEAFTNIPGLFAQYNHITTLNLSQNTQLAKVNVSNNNLTSINLDNCGLLSFLSFEFNQVAAIDLTDCVALTQLFCNNNSLTALSVPNSPMLSYLVCRSNMLTALDVSNCLELLSIYCNLNQLTTIDVSNNTQLLVLYCGDNALTTLDVTQNTELTTLYCPNNDLTQLDITQNPHLYALYCFYNNLAALDLSQSHELALLSCGYNPGLTALYFNETPALMHLNCLQIPVVSLDMSACPALQLFVVGGCAQLKNINLKNGHNNTFNTGYFNLTNLPALETVCVDDEDSVFADWVTAQTVEGVTVTETCILDVDDVSLNPVAFYPNPVSSMLYITGADVTEIYLYNNLGQKVCFYEYTVAIDVSALPDGIYFVKAKDAEGALTVKSITKHSGIGF